MKLIKTAIGQSLRRGGSGFQQAACRSSFSARASLLSPLLSRWIIEWFSKKNPFCRAFVLGSYWVIPGKRHLRNSSDAKSCCIGWKGGLSKKGSALVNSATRGSVEKKSSLACSILGRLKSRVCNSNAAVCISLQLMNRGRLFHPFNSLSYAWWRVHQQQREGRRESM